MIGMGGGWGIWIDRFSLGIWTGKRDHSDTGTRECQTHQLLDHRQKSRCEKNGKRGFYSHICVSEVPRLCDFCVIRDDEDCKDIDSEQGTGLACYIGPMSDKSMEGLPQQTIRTPVSCEGIGLHSGRSVSLRLFPAEADSGIRFRVRAEASGFDEIEARIDLVRETSFATTIGRGSQFVQTVEHLLAAASGLRIDNLLVELDAPEVPILDGSARPFAELLAHAGVRRQPAPRTAWSVTKSFTVRDETGWIEATPAPRLEVENTVDYDHPAIGRQTFTYTDDGPETFLEELAGARTFGFLEDIDRLKAAGLIKGGSLDNALVIGPDGVLNPGGFRWSDECVRHKVLDLLGDLSLLGKPLNGRIRAFKAGHTLHAKFVTYLAAHPEVRLLQTIHATEPVSAIA